MGEERESVPEDAVVSTMAEASLPTRQGVFEAAVFRIAEQPFEALAAIRGQLDDGRVPLVRLHSECLTGDAFGSLRCDCGEQLEEALRSIAEAGSGVLLYLRQEGRGIGLANKLRAYALQDRGLDTVDANVALGLPVDARRYASAAAVLRHLGVRRLRLLTNNPDKQRALEQCGLVVTERVPLEITPNPYNRRYLETKAARMGHLLPSSADLLGERSPAPGHGSEAKEPLELDEQESGTPRAAETAPAADPATTAAPRTRPSVTVHYAQTLDGRIATRTGNSQWISGQETLRFAHQLRATHDAVMVGIGTVLADDPRLTVRLAPGRSPLRVVVDSHLRLPHGAKVLAKGAAQTLVATTPTAPRHRRRALEDRGAEILVCEPDGDGQVSLSDLLARLAARGVTTLLVEGGARLITTVVRERAFDRLAVTIAPKLIGAGIEAVADLGILRLDDAITFARTEFRQLGPDVVFDGWVTRAAAAEAA